MTVYTPSGGGGGSIAPIVPHPGPPAYIDVSSGGSQSTMRMGVISGNVGGIQWNPSSGAAFIHDQNTNGAALTLQAVNGASLTLGNGLQLIPGAGWGVLLAGNATPPATPSAPNGLFYVTASGALHWRGPTTDTQIAPA
jgi:hypothetical protein